MRIVHAFFSVKNSVQCAVEKAVPEVGNKNILFEAAEHLLPYVP
jgi:hypothetical protein